ncbi:MAG: SIS domain-containing protein, partial [Dehalococcoidia bacterium]
RYGFTGRTLDGAGVEALVLDAQGEGVLAQILSTVLMGDYVSYYLALLNGVDPVPTRAIDDLKAWLAQQG